MSFILPPTESFKLHHNPWGLLVLWENLLEAGGLGYQYQLSAPLFYVPSVPACIWAALSLVDDSPPTRLALQVWLSLVLMVASASFGAYTDVRFHLEGYLWQLLNCFLTSAYALYLSGTMERVGRGGRRGGGADP